MTNTSPTSDRKMKVESVAEHKNRAVTPEERYLMIAEAAYFRALKRGFVGGDMAEDWLVAEAEIDRNLQQREIGESVALSVNELEAQVQAEFENETTTIAEKVRAITLQALSNGELDKTSLKRVISAVIAGVQRGVAQRAEQGVPALKEAIRGLDEALAAAAEATQLALQEAAGRSTDFSRQALKNTADDLVAMESLFIEILADRAKNAAGFARATLSGLAEHARASGTAVGVQVDSALTQLTRALAETAHEQVETGAQTLRKEGALLAGLAAGMLKGIAERLQLPPENNARNSHSAKRSGR